MKSYVSNLVDLSTALVKDAFDKCTAEVNDRDLCTIRSRVEHEGLSFLTITLPTLAKDFDIALAQEEIDSTAFRSFKKVGRIPAFLQGIFSLVFDKTSGRILHEPDISAIEAIRQVGYSFKKIKIECTKERTEKALQKYVESERVFDVCLCPDLVERFDAASRIIWNPIWFRNFNHLELIPKHGPGATVEGFTPNAKWKQNTWHQRLEPFFPVMDYIFPSPDPDWCHRTSLWMIPEDREKPVRVTTVPKTLKTPRIIAIEPTCMQYTQQALMRYLVDALEHHKHTAGHINFTDQSVNRNLALSASADGKFATLDMSSASDRVPYSIAIRMFQGCPDLQGAISASRSTRAELPNGDVIPLKKFASMGSATCFPVEAMYFYTLCVMALIEKRGLPLTSLSYLQVKDDVYVYGDDIIVPTDAAEQVTDTLQKYYCKVNVRKSFSSGKFRESCGMDAYDGEEVTPIYIRTLPPCNRKDASELISWTASSNNLYRKGYWKTADLIMRTVEKITGNLPVISPKLTSCLGKTSFQRWVSSHRWHRTLHRPEVKTWVVKSVKKADPLDGARALVKCFLTQGSCEALSNRDHLAKSELRGAVTLKRRWICPA